MTDTLTEIPKNSIFTYADDSNLKISAKTEEEIERLAYVEMENIQQYLKNHNLHLNIGKTNLMLFKTQQNKNKLEPNILINETIIERKYRTNFLGLEIDENLSWNDHVQKVIRKINSGIYALSKMSTLVNIQTLRSIYFSYIHSHISFGICLYGATKNSNLDQILKIQKKSIRIILKLKKDESVRKHFRKLQILTVYGQYIFDAILLAKNKLADHNIYQPNHSYNTRRKNEMLPCHRLKFFTKKPTYMGVYFLKFIPQKIKQEKRLNLFKKALREYLINNTIYSLSDFYEITK